MLPNASLEGKNVRLRPVAEDDLPSLLEWLNDPEVNRWLALPQGPPVSLEAEHRWLVAIKEDPSQIAWSIETKDGILLGDLVLHLSQVHPESAQLGLFIGNKERWSQGLGTDAVTTFLAHAFDSLGLHRVYLQVDAENSRAHRCFEKSGFRREGLVREFRRRWGDEHFVDGLLMAVLSDEFQG